MHLIIWVLYVLSKRLYVIVVGVFRIPTYSNKMIIIKIALIIECFFYAIKKSLLAHKYYFKYFLVYIIYFFALFK